MLVACVSRHARRGGAATDLRPPGVQLWQGGPLALLQHAGLALRRRLRVRARLGHHHGDVAARAGAAVRRVALAAPLHAPPALVIAARAGGVGR